MIRVTKSRKGRGRKKVSVAGTRGGVESQYRIRWILLSSCCSTAVVLVVG